LAAGVVVFRPGREVLLVHRPKYDDWSFPKGKLDPGEHLTACAVREVEEETGLRVRLGPALPRQRYPVAGGRHKVVSYWVGRAVADDDVSGYEPNDEIDRVEWVPYDLAKRRLTYSHDRETLKLAKKLRKRTRPVIVLRHGHACPRKQWTGDDRRRPLHPDGEEQARTLVATLAAYDVCRIVSSSSTRCVQTVEPYADASGWPLERTRALSEEDATAGSVLALVDDLVAERESAVLCTHRPVLPTVFDALGVEDPGLAPGAMLVVHLRRGEVVATEVHQTA
ncbi:MAG: NUDIX hydrolase, partial [Catenulispora sp.]|nr:NUDIX hydrolase [Catenulispora sp.]